MVCVVLLPFLILRRHPERGGNDMLRWRYDKLTPTSRTRARGVSPSERPESSCDEGGSHKSLMFPVKGKELFHHKKCKFTFQGVDQTLRRPLAVLLFRNCCKRNYVSKDNGQFQKAKLRLRRLFSLQPKVQHYSTPASLRVTKSAFILCLMRRFASPTSKTASRFWNCNGYVSS